jgi:Phosphotransacetylase
MIKDFAALVERTQALGMATMAVAAAEDEEVLEAAREAAELSLARSILVGDGKRIRELAGPGGLPPLSRIVEASTPLEAALEAARLVRSGEADILVKGMVNSSDFLRAALDPQRGLRGDRLLSHFAAFEIPGEDRLSFHSDGGMVIQPGLEEKKQILSNALDALHRLGIAEPKVAILAANEQVNPKMTATLDARDLVEAWRAGEFPGCLVEGPIAMDVASSAEAARRKGIASSVSGEVDLFILPNIEAGNIAGKILLHYAHARMAGIVLGAAKPIVLVSRSDDAAAKLHSIALASLAR